MKIALTGNPNSGKTTLYNAITGSTEKVGNWAGVTVSKKEADVKKSLCKDGLHIVAVDLPGAYSMSPFTSEESITRDYVENEKPDVIINIVDSTNISRSLFFTTQLLELNIPVVIALNKSDAGEKKADINALKLSKLLHCPVIKTVSTSSNNNGLEQLINKAIEISGKSQQKPFNISINGQDKKSITKADKDRYEQVKKIVSQVENRKERSNKITTQDKVDKVLAHKWIGIPIFIAVMWAVFEISQVHLGPLVADTLASWIDMFYEWVAGLLGENASPVLTAIVLDGIIGGVGAVVGFLPLIMVMFFLLALLEDCGYMARVAVVMDRFFKIVGLSGKSIIPMVIGTGCAIPGVMATRTIKDPRQRRTTAMLTPFIPCGAKLPVIALFAGVFFNGSGWVSATMYAVGIVLIIVGAFLIVRITGEKNKKTFFIMELSEYKIPSLKRATLSMLSRAKAFIIKAGTIVLLCNMIVQLMQTFNWQFQVVAEGAENTSILASIATPFAFVLIPLGFGVWQLAAASITGFIAKENVVGTLAVVYGITNFIDTEELVMTGGATQIAQVMGLTSVAALAYLMFNLFTPPCFAAIGAMNAEMESKKWLWAGIGLQFGTGYTVSFLVYQAGTIITTGNVGAGFIPGLIAVLLMVGLVVFLTIKGQKKSAQTLTNYAKKA